MKNIIAYSMEKLYKDLEEADELFLSSGMKDMELYEKQLAEAARKAAAEHMAALYSDMDRMLCEDISRAEKYTIQRHDERQLLTTVGPVCFTHTLFRSRKDGTCHYLLDWEEEHIVKDILLYANYWFTKGKHSEENDYAAQARIVKEAGFTGLKFDPFAHTNYFYGEDLASNLTLTPAQQDLAFNVSLKWCAGMGPEMDIMIEHTCHVELPYCRENGGTFG